MTFHRPSPEERHAAREAEKARNLAALAPVHARPLARGTYAGSAHQVQPKAKPKIERKVRQDIRDSARGEECTVRLIGVCNHDPETTVWSHYPRNDAGKGMGTKSLDLAGCYCCSACHDVVDGRAPMSGGLSRAFVMLAWFEGHMRSLIRLAEKGLL